MAEKITSAKKSRRDTIILLFALVITSAFGELKWISIKKEHISLYLVYNIVSLGKMTGKAEPFSWRSVEDELAVKCLENLDV